MKPRPAPDSPRKTLRCAIYTRVSTDAGLEQDFNSLDAQREASEAYIKSQAHEGWKLNRDRFDDGGFSGGSMERPALLRLLDDVRARKIDVIVVYKVDRLTRSLADFAKLVELFDQHSVSFVSVTQSFNTTTSMGRLTLNVLLSFAQFEREVTGERIRDKIAASKRKGIWMGGNVPLGYRVEDRKLLIEPEEANTVRLIFDRYLALGSLTALLAELRERDVRTRRRTSASGKTVGGVHFMKGALAWLLKNRIYVGEIQHGTSVHAGLHEPILDRAVFDAAQEKLNRRVTHRYRRDASEALLIGKLFDDRGNRMTPTWAAKGGRRWRYYVSSALTQGRKAEAGSVVRVPAEAIERLVVGAVAGRVTPSGRTHTNGAAQSGCALAQIGPREAHSERSGYEWRSAKSPKDPSTQSPSLPADRRAESDQLSEVDRIDLGATCVDIHMSEKAQVAGADALISIHWTRPSSRRQRGILGSTYGSSSRPMDSASRKIVIAALGRAHRWLDELMSNSSASTDSIATREHQSERSIRRTLSLAFLAPDIATAAFDGRLPRGLTLTRMLDLPSDWREQRELLGLEAKVAS